MKVGDLAVTWYNVPIADVFDVPGKDTAIIPMNTTVRIEILFDMDGVPVAEISMPHLVIEGVQWRLHAIALLAGLVPIGKS